MRSMSTDAAGCAAQTISLAHMDTDGRTAKPTRSHDRRDQAWGRSDGEDGTAADAAARGATTLAETDRWDIARRVNWPETEEALVAPHAEENGAWEGRSVQDSESQSGATSPRGRAASDASAPTAPPQTWLAAIAPRALHPGKPLHLQPQFRFSAVDAPHAT